MEEEEIVNRVANSSLINIDLQDFYPKGERVLYDLKQNLWQELVLKETEFRAFVKENDWSQYQDKYVAIDCSVDAILPSWAYLLLTVALSPYAKKVVQGNLKTLELVIFQDVIADINVNEYADKRIIIKGCSDLPIPDQAYVDLVQKLKPNVKSLMFGEACSTVPLFKK